MATSRRGRTTVGHGSEYRVQGTGDRVQGTGGQGNSLNLLSDLYGDLKARPHSSEYRVQGTGGQGTGYGGRVKGTG